MNGSQGPSSGTARHHVVSRGYQRLFADGEQIRRVEKTTRRAIIVGTRDAFVERHFNSWEDNEGNRDDELEHQWSVRENECLPVLRSLVAGRDTSAGAREAVKIVAAIHFSRSYAFAEVQQRIAEEVTDQHAASADGRDHLRAAFREQEGRDPYPGEIAAAVRRGAEAQFGGRRQLIRDMAYAYNRALEMMTPLFVQLVWKHRPFIDFVFGDHPVVHSDRRRVGLRQLPLGEATRIFMPLSSTVGALFTTRQTADIGVAPAVIQRLNLQTWQAAERYIAGHPSTELSASLAMNITDHAGQRR